MSSCIKVSIPEVIPEVIPNPHPLFRNLGFSKIKIPKEESVTLLVFLGGLVVKSTLLLVVLQTHQQNQHDELFVVYSHLLYSRSYSQATSVV